jgi:tetratricopeptide (TPR) repeat protein
VKSGKYAKLEKYLSDYALTAATNDLNYMMNFTGIQFINANQTIEANKYFDKIISSKESAIDTVNLAAAYYFKGDYKQAQALYKNLYEKHTNNIRNLVRLAISNVKNENIEAAKTYMETLNTLKGEYQFGAIDYGWAQYYASKDDKDKALEFLLKAVVQGYNFTPSTFQNDPHFIAIKDSPEFNTRIMNYWKNKTL